MRKFAFGTVAVMFLFALSVAGPASATDDKASSSTTNTATTPSIGLSAPTPAPAPARKAKTHTNSSSEEGYKWSGFSLGGSFGYVQGNGDTIFNPLPNAEDFEDLEPQSILLHPHGVIGGVRGGYDFQHGNWVFGLAVDFSGTGVSGNALETPIINSEGLPDTPPGGSTLTAKEELKFLSTIRGRAGFVVDKRVLFYATGGVAMGRFILGADANYPEFEFDYPTDISRFKVGWVAGGGIEYAVCKRWHAGVEYLYYEFPSESKVVNQIPAEPPFQILNNWAAMGQIAQGVLTYRFK